MKTKSLVIIDETLSNRKKKHKYPFPNNNSGPNVTGRDPDITKGLKKSLATMG